MKGCRNPVVDECKKSTKYGCELGHCSNITDEHANDVKSLS